MILRERIARTEILKINRPEARNAIDVETNQAMADAFDEIGRDSGIDSVVLTGVGEKAFCVGVDLKEVDQLGNEMPFRQTNGGFGGLIQRDLPQILIAAVNGYALGGGFELMLACDLVVASEDAVFASPEAYLGILADGGAMVRLPRQLPMPVAKEILLLGERFSAARAYEMGLVNRVVPQSDVLDCAMTLAQRVSEGAPRSLRMTKKVIDQGSRTTWEAAWEINDAAAREIEETQDSLEGPKAFSESRKPDYQGR